MIHDVVVLGATIAGLTAARTLARAGFDVIVLDPNVAHRSAAIGHGVAAPGHASTLIKMRDEYNEAVAVEHVARNLRGTEFIRGVLAEANLEAQTMRFVDGSLPDAAREVLLRVEDLLVKGGAEVRIKDGKVVSEALVLNPDDYARTLREQTIDAGAQIAHGVTVMHVSRKDAAIGVAFRNNLAWAREPGAVLGAAVIDTLGISPWGQLARVGQAQVVPTITARLSAPTDEVTLYGEDPVWMVRPDGDHHLVLGQKSAAASIEANTAELRAYLEAQGAEIVGEGRLVIDPSDHGRPVVGASGIPGGYYVRGNGRGEMMNGTASGLWLAETLIGSRAEGRSLPLTRRMRAQAKSWLLKHRR